MAVNRRTCLAGWATAAAGLAATSACAQPAPQAASTQPAAVKNPIVLYCDLSVPADREAEMLKHFHAVFVPTAQSFKGFIDLKLLKVRTVIQGHPLPAGINYRFQLTYESEELRQLWVKSDAHQRVWPPIERLLADPQYQVALFDAA